MQYSKVESDRFGLATYRQTIEDLNATTLKREIFATRADLVILRIPSADQHRLAMLDRIGFPYIVADTLIHYVSDLSEPSGPLRNEGINLQEIEAAELPTLASLVREIFPGYTNHYNSNPLLPLDEVLDGYVEWAEAYAAGDGTAAYLVKDDDEVLGFATCRFDEAARSMEGVLYGVRPSAAGRGVYTDIIRLTREVGRERGFDKMTVSTQVQNLAVQKAWIRSGFTVLRSEATVHINALLTSSAIPEREVAFTASLDDSASYGNVSGDTNLLHSDDSFAQERGFAGAFAHGLVANGLLSREYGMVYPGPGTVFSGYRYTFFKPMYLGQEYRLRIRFPRVSASGYHYAVAEIEDDRGPCLVAYCDLILTRPKSND